MEDLEIRAKKLADENKGVKKVALSHSGGLDSAVIGTLLQSAGFSVTPIVVNMGQQSDFARIEKNARAMFGKCVVVDARQHFAENIMRGIKANCSMMGHVNMGGLSRPALARAVCEEARKQGCDAIAHGASGTGNDHLTMENSLRVLAPDMRIMAVVRDLDLKRDSELAYAKKKKLQTNLERAAKFSADENLWARSIRQGSTLDYDAPLPEDAYKWTVSPQKAPDKAADVEIEFENGIPIHATINGKKHSGILNIITALNETGGKHGVGRLDALDDKVVGLKIREVFECPAALILLSAHRELERLTLTTKELSAKRTVDAAWNQLVHDGGWYTRLRRFLDAFIDESQRPVDGSVALELYKGSTIIKGRKSRNALYDKRLSARDTHGVFSQKEARQFAKLYGLQDVIAYMIDSE